MSKLLVIDNYDSFTFNVVRYFRELGAEVVVARNDQITINEIETLSPMGLVISPGPCTPNEAGISLQAIQYFAGKTPILGVCLGHQAIGQVFGAEVVRATQVMHGKTSCLQHAEQGLFAGLPQAFQIARYHSLVLEPSSLPTELRVDAWVERIGAPQEIMAIAHRHWPIWGVQYHPEAIQSEFGHAIFAKFLQLAQKNN